MRLFVLLWVTPYHEHTLPGTCLAPNLSKQAQWRNATCLLELLESGASGRGKLKKVLQIHDRIQLAKCCVMGESQPPLSLWQSMGHWGVQTGVFQQKKHHFSLFFIWSKVVCSLLQRCFRLREGNFPTQRCFLSRCLRWHRAYQTCADASAVAIGLRSLSVQSGESRRHFSHPKEYPNIGLWLGPI